MPLRARIVARYLAAMEERVYVKLDQEMALFFSEGDLQKKVSASGAEYVYTEGDVRLTLRLQPQRSVADDDEGDGDDGVLYDAEWWAEAPIGKRVAGDDVKGLTWNLLRKDSTQLRKTVVFPAQAAFKKAVGVSNKLREKKEKAARDALQKKMRDLLGSLADALGDATGRNWEPDSGLDVEGSSVTGRLECDVGQVQLKLTQGASAMTLDATVTTEDGSTETLAGVTFKRISVKELAKPIALKWNAVGLNADSLLYWGVPDNDRETKYYALSEKALHRFLVYAHEAALEGRLEDDIKDLLPDAMAEREQAIRAKYEPEIRRVQKPFDEDLQAAYAQYEDITRSEMDREVLRSGWLEYTEKKEDIENRASIAVGEVTAQMDEELESLKYRVRDEIEKVVSERHKEELSGSGDYIYRTTFREEFPQERLLTRWLGYFRKHPTEVESADF